MEVALHSSYSSSPLTGPSSSARSISNGQDLSKLEGEADRTFDNFLLRSSLLALLSWCASLLRLRFAVTAVLVGFGRSLLALRKGLLWLDFSILGGSTPSAGLLARLLSHGLEGGELGFAFRIEGDVGCFPIGLSGTMSMILLTVTDEKCSGGDVRRRTLSSELSQQAAKRRKSPSGMALKSMVDMLADRC